MKKITALLLAGAMLCVMLVGCVSHPDEPTTGPTADTTPTAIPTTEPTTEPVSVPTMGDNVMTPNEMPDPPENDYSLPPGERPGDRNEVIDR